MRSIIFYAWILIFGYIFAQEISTNNNITNTTLLTFKNCYTNADCNNHGKCTTLNYCNCDNGYWGLQCEKAYCRSDRDCFNGRCNFYSETCECYEGSYGDHCEYENSGRFSILPAIIFPILGFLLLFCCCFCLFRSRCCGKCGRRQYGFVVTNPPPTQPAFTDINYAPLPTAPPPVQPYHGCHHCHDTPPPYVVVQGNR